MSNTRTTLIVIALASTAALAAVAATDGAGIPGAVADGGPKVVPLATRARQMRAARKLGPIAEALTAASVHDPFGSEDCASCHESGDKSAPGAVVDATNALCLKCHDDPGMNGDVALKHQHGGEGGRCTDCHNPHNSVNDKLLHEPVRKLCASCHVEKVKGAVEHAPLSSPESCTKCHAAHGADEQHLLTAPFATSFYVPYKREAYALCFTCHDAKLVEEPRTSTATKFRDGTKNLHTVHVMREDKGRSCAACHDLHAGKRATLVHDDVAFGSHGWRLPLAFTATESGGSCAKSCHTERSYDRDRARR